MAGVEVYTNKGCAACVNAKHFLDNKGVDYTEMKLQGGGKQLPHFNTNDAKICYRRKNLKINIET